MTRPMEHCKLNEHIRYSAIRMIKAHNSLPAVKLSRKETMLFADSPVDMHACLTLAGMRSLVRSWPLACLVEQACNCLLPISPVRFEENFPCKSMQALFGEKFILVHPGTTTPRWKTGQTIRLGFSIHSYANGILINV